MERFEQAGPAPRRRPGCRMLRLAAGLVVLPLLTPLTLFPQFFPSSPGQWEQRLDLQVLPEYRLSPAEGREFGRRLETLAAILRDAQVFKPPLGFPPRLRARF
jgi:hypothetical protein